MIAACLKWTAPAGEGEVDERFAGVSAADQAALEVALTLAEQLGEVVTAVVAGPPGADRVLREALACGAHHVVRIDTTTELGSADVARELATVVADAAVAASPTVIVCGDSSLDRGSGAVPAFLAHRLGVAQALGLLSVDLVAGTLTAVRRLDGGRRELLHVPMPCVLSVEGSVASLRRAGLHASLASAAAPIDVHLAAVTEHGPPVGIVTAFRPRARVMPPPTGDDVLGRLRALTDAGAAITHGEHVELEPRAAAEHIVHALRTWGYLD